MEVHPTSNLNEVVSVITDAFTVAPWHIPSMPRTEITTRLNLFLPSQRFLLGLFKDKQSDGSWCGTTPVNMLGVTWFGAPRAHIVPDDVSRYVAAHYPSRPIVYYGATAVRSAWQGKGFAKMLKAHALNTIAEFYPSSVVVTRMRPDNVRMMHINENHGFKPTGYIEDHQDGTQAHWWVGLTE